MNAGEIDLFLTIKQFNDYTIGVPESRRKKHAYYLRLVENLKDRQKSHLIDMNDLESIREAARQRVRDTAVRYTMYLFATVIEITLFALICHFGLFKSHAILYLIVGIMAVLSPFQIIFFIRWMRNICIIKRSLPFEKSPYCNLWKCAIHFNIQKQKLLRFHYCANYGDEPHIHEPVIEVKNKKAICRFDNLVSISAVEKRIHQNEKYVGSEYFIVVVRRGKSSGHIKKEETIATFSDLKELYVPCCRSPWSEESTADLWRKAIQKIDAVVKRAGLTDVIVEMNCVRHQYNNRDQGHM